MADSVAFELPIVVMDNHRAHTCNITMDSLADLNFEPLFLAPHSSQLNPVEHVWRCFKHYWCQRAFERVDFDPTAENMDEEIGHCMRQISAEAVRSLSKACHGLYAEVLTHQPGDQLPRGLPWAED